MAALLLGVALDSDRKGYPPYLRFQVKPGMMADFTAAVEADQAAMQQISEVLLVRCHKSYGDLESGDGKLSMEVWRRGGG